VFRDVSVLTLFVKSQRKRLGSSTELGAFNRDFRFCPVNGHRQSVGPLPKRPAADILDDVNEKERPPCGGLSKVVSRLHAVLAA
jgi:hypothetical protein